MSFKERVVILREVGLRGGYAPLECTLVRLNLAHQDLEQAGCRTLIFSNKADLVALLHDKGYIIQQFFAVYCLGNAADLENILARFPIHREADPRIAAGRRRHLLDRKLVDQLAAAGRLTDLDLFAEKR